MAQEKSIISVFESCKVLSEDINKKIKEKIALSDDDKKNLTTLNYNFEQVLNFIKSCFITRADDGGFYGAFLLSLETIIDQSIRGFIDSKLEKASIKFIFNPLFIPEVPITMVTEIMGIIEAEINRLVYLHPESFANLNSGRDKFEHELLEKASDTTTSSLMAKDNRIGHKSGLNIRLPRNFFSTGSLTKEVGRKVEEERPLEYYFEILRKYTKREQAPNFSASESGDNSDDPNNSIASPGNNSGNTTHDWEGKDSIESTELIKSAVRDAMDSIPERNRGMIPGGIMQQIQKIMKPPEISWQQVLKRFIGCLPSGYRKTPIRLNRRQPERFDLMGTISKKVVKIVVCIDTSGSMSDSDIAYVLNEVFHISKSNGATITIIECDSKVTRVYQAKNPKEVKAEVTGRGGTCFTPAIEYINNNNYFRDALMIYFTDGYGEWEIPKPKTYKNLWLVLKDESCLSVKKPYGEVKALMKDKKYKKYY